MPAQHHAHLLDTVANRGRGVELLAVQLGRLFSAIDCGTTRSAHHVLPVDCQHTVIGKPMQEPMVALSNHSG